MTDNDISTAPVHSLKITSNSVYLSGTKVSAIKALKYEEEANSLGIVTLQLFVDSMRVEIEIPKFDGADAKLIHKSPEGYEFPYHIILVLPQHLQEAVAEYEAWRFGLTKAEILERYSRFSANEQTEQPEAILS